VRERGADAVSVGEMVGERLPPALREGEAFPLGLPVALGDSEGRGEAEAPGGAEGAASEVVERRGDTDTVGSRVAEAQGVGVGVPSATVAVELGVRGAEIDSDAPEEGVGAVEGCAVADGVPQGEAGAVRVALSVAAGDCVPERETAAVSVGETVGAAESDPCGEPLLQGEGVAVALSAGLAVPSSEAEDSAETVSAALPVAAPGLPLAQGDAVGE
jgi:hypothetical protein